MYAAGWNMPGYLPETEPETFDTVAEAVNYLRDTVERWMDQDASLDEWADCRTGSDFVDDTGHGAYGNVVFWVEPVFDDGHWPEVF